MTISVNKKWHRGSVGAPIEYLKLAPIVCYTLDCNGQDTRFCIDDSIPDNTIHALNQNGEIIVSKIQFEMVADGLVRCVFQGKGYTNGTPVYLCNIDTMYNVVDYAEDLYFRSCQTLDDIRKG